MKAHFTIASVAADASQLIELTDGQVVIRRASGEWYLIGKSGAIRFQCYARSRKKLERAYQEWVEKQGEEADE